MEASLVIVDRCRFHGRIKALGDVDVGSEVLIEGNLVTEGSVKIGKNTKIKGSVNAEGSVRLGENSSIGLALTSGGDVELHKDVRVFKNISRKATYMSYGRLKKKCNKLFSGLYSSF